MKKTTLFPSGPFILLALLLWLGSLGTAWAQCAAPTGLTISAISGTSATLSFTPAAGAVSYTVSYTATNGSTVTTISPNPTAAPVTLTGLSPASGYTVTVITNCAGGVTGGGATVSFATVARNDEPCTALVLPVGATCQPLNTTSVGSTITPANGYSLLGCSGSQRPNDVWYTFTTAAAGPASTGATITVSGQYANQVRVFAAASCAGPFADVACSTATSANGPAPALTLGSLQPATTYYVAVSQYSQSDPSGPFTICVSEPPACAPPLNVALDAVGATTARLTLRPGPGNLSYLVQYYPTAQPSQVQTLVPAPTASPILLTGLLPLTAYTVTVQGACASGLATPAATLALTTTNPQDDPADAVALPVAAACQPVSGTVAGATATVPSGYTNPPACAPGVSQPRDVWYTVRTAASGAASTGLSITAAGDAAGILRLFSSAGGAAGPFTELGCAADLLPPNPSVAPPLTVLGLSPSTTYYLSVAPRLNGAPQQAGFTVCATPPLPCPPPQALAATSLTQSGATLNWSVPAPVSGTFTLEYGPRGFPPGTGTVVAGLTGTSYVIASGLSPQTNYDFYVQRDCGGAGLSARTGPAQFRTLAPPTTAPANDEPCSAQALPLSGPTCQSPTAGTLQFATVYLGDPTRPRVVGYRCGTNGNGPAPPTGTNSASSDVFYRFTTAAAGTGPASTGANITVTGTYGPRLVQVLQASSCAGPFTVLGCSAAGDQSLTARVSPLVVTGLTPSTTYYVGVFTGYDQNRPQYPANADLSFTICVSDPLACPPPTALTVGPITSSGGTLAFTPAALGTAYTVTVTPTAGGPAAFTQTVTSSPVTLSGLQPNTAYTACLTSACGATAGVPFCGGSFTTLLPGPPNYTCANAIPLTCGQSVTGTNANVPQVPYPPSAPGATYNDLGVYYSFIGTGDSINVSTCSPNTLQVGSAVGIYTGTCSNLVGLTGSNYSTNCSSGSLYGTTTFLSTAGTQYYIYVATAFQGGGGPFGLTLTCIPAPCPTPLAVSASNITTTSASIGFAPAAGSAAPGYTVTATPTGGGAPVTATGSTAPIALTGLAPGTSYSIRVVANCTAVSASLPTPAFTLTTAGPPCPAPTALSVGSVTTTGATVSFTGASLPTGYTLTATPASGPALTVTGAAAPLTPAGLTPGTTYALSLVANCPGGAVSAAAVGTLTTTSLPCLAPTGLAAAQLLPTSASLSFTPAAGSAPVTGYTVTVTPASGPALTFTGAASPVALTGLLPNSAYTVTVTATCSPTSTSPASAALALRTPLAVRNADLAAQVGLFPNPAHTAATLTVPASLLGRAVGVTLYNALGQVARTYPALTTTGPAELDLTGLPAGVYQLRLQTAQGTVSKRLLVE